MVACFCYVIGTTKSHTLAHGEISGITLAPQVTVMDGNIIAGSVLLHRLKSVGSAVTRWVDLSTFWWKYPNPGT